MPTHILVATPHPAFGELIRLSLEESSNYRVRLVQTSLDGIAAVGRTDFDIAILDSDLRDQPPAALAKIIRQQRPDIHLIFIPPNNDPNHPSLAGIKIDGILKKPFYLPDLITMVETLISPQAIEPEPMQSIPAPAVPETGVMQMETQVADEMPWLSDQVQAAQHLTRLLLESSAHAALILQNNRIWAYAGHLDQPAAQEVTSVIARYWKWEQKVDLARFVRLDTTNTDYLLYATSMKGVYVLALVFDIAMPLTRIRTQANNLARELSTLPVENKSAVATLLVEPAIEQTYEIKQEVAPAESDVEIHPAAPAVAETPQPENTPDATLAETPPTSVPLAATPVPTPTETAEEIQNLYEDGFEDEYDNPDLNLAKFLENVPPPNPPAANDLKPEPSKKLETPEFIFPWEETTSSINSHAAPTIPMRIRDFQPAPDQNKNTQTPADLEATRQTSRAGGPAVHPETEKPIASLTEMESALPGLSHLAYTCILVPRMPNHYLNGELAEKLGIWTPQLCLAFGWRLEALSIRPGYLQWNVRVLPAVSPGALLRILRQRLSERIFLAFPKLRGQNPSGDFWAQGYLIISGSTPPSNQLVQDYIRQTRQRQGLSSN